MFILYSVVCVLLLCCDNFQVDGTGVLILYRPKDISNACAFSERLRYDLSFGMGMSDTITLVLRTLNELDYECDIEIVSDVPWARLITVLRYPTTKYINCAINQDAFYVLKRNYCQRICDTITYDDRNTNYFTFVVKERLRMRFLSNSSINADLKADLYQITVTTARELPHRGARCMRRNESICVVGEKRLCFTSGVVCDGIKNCGTEDWFDERRSECTHAVEKLGLAPVLAVLATLCCVFLACGHLLLRCLPPLTKSFFIFNANEDNRLCIDPILVPVGKAPELEQFKRMSIIPVSSSSSEEAVEEVQTVLKNLDTSNVEKDAIIAIKTETEEELPESRKGVKSLTSRIHLFREKYFRKQSMKSVFDA